MRPAAWFIVVGSAATALHFVVVVYLVSQHGLPPLAANVLGWACAVGLSFLGHYRLSFAGQHAPIGRAARRFVVMSAGGFAINEASYALLLRSGGLGYQLALALVLIGVALLTYWISRRWAFAANGR